MFHNRRRVSRDRIAAELTDYLEVNPHVKVGIFWPNFHLLETSSHEENEEARVIQGEEGGATPKVVESKHPYAYAHGLVEGSKEQGGP